MRKLCWLTALLLLLTTPMHGLAPCSAAVDCCEGEAYYHSAYAPALCPAYAIGSLVLITIAVFALSNHHHHHHHPH